LKSGDKACARKAGRHGYEIVRLILQAIDLFLSEAGADLKSRSFALRLQLFGNSSRSCE